MTYLNKVLTLLLLCIEVTIAITFSNGTTPGSCGFTDVEWKLMSHTYMGDTIDPFTQLSPLDTIDAGQFGTFYIIITDVNKNDSLKSFTYTLAHIAPDGGSEYKCSEHSWFNTSLPDSSADFPEVKPVPNSWADTLNKAIRFFPISTLLKISDLSWTTEYKATSHHRTYYISNASMSWLKFRFSFGDYGHETSFRQLLSRFEYRVSSPSTATFNINSVVLGDTVLLSKCEDDTVSRAVVHASNSEGKCIVFLKRSWLYDNKYTYHYEDLYNTNQSNGSIITRTGEKWNIAYNQDAKQYQFTYDGAVDSNSTQFDSLKSDIETLNLKSGHLEYRSIRNDSLFGIWELRIPVSGSQEIANRDTVAAALGDTLYFLGPDVWSPQYQTKCKIIDLFSGTDYKGNQCLYSSVKVFYDYPVSIMKDKTPITPPLSTKGQRQFVLFNVRGQQLESFSSSKESVTQNLQSFNLPHGYYILKEKNTTVTKSYPVVIK